MEAIRAKGVIHYEEVVVFLGLLLLSLLGGLFGIGVFGLGGHGASWYDVDASWEAIRS
jgi:hypothetical protein